MSKDSPGFRERIRSRPGLGHAYRVTVAVIGGSIILLGILLLVLPGPGWLVIFLGLGVLASEFHWARRLLHYSRVRVLAWTDWAGRQPLLVRILLGGGVLIAVALAAAGYVVWVGLPSW